MVIFKYRINQEKCICGNFRHTSNISETNEVWNWEKHTAKEETKCYGVLPHSNSPYLRCDVKEVNKVGLVLFGVWNIPIPSMIMRMVGDATSTLNVTLEKEVLRGISDAAVASDAWIITSGYKEETTSELIGEIVYKNRVKNAELNFSAIAVGKWGNIRDREKLYGSGNRVCKHGPSAPGRYTLEPNHTHYICFDDGSYNSPDNGEFASRLARQISYGARRRIPLVTIVAGGNLYALKSIWVDLIYQVSVVIVDQSGPLANILCKHYKATKNISKATRTQTDEDIDRDKRSSDDENDIDMVMFEYSFTLPKPGEEPPSTELTLREVLRPFSKRERLDIYNDLLKLYIAIRKEEYKTAGKKLPAGELLNLGEKRTLANYIFWFATCLTFPLRDNIHIFDFNTSTSLQSTLYGALVQGKSE
ncbi:unnamed protein product [Adineta steineri]|uniref:TRPM SLOG domain-containing protein n=1 Tax=Adineta steineri TaxID=433720 RepID=A0A814SZ70_9BILA|nr:unnamed protein product [Adineta steineri]CAF4039235.1 unnamed protein product [Adineta steineri]